MSKDEVGGLSEAKLEPHDKAEQLIKQGKIEEAARLLEGREKKEGIEELRWRLLESRCNTNKGDFEKVIEITDQIIKELDELVEPVKLKPKYAIRIKVDSLNEQVWALIMRGRLDDGLKQVDKGIRLIEELEKLEVHEDNCIEPKDKERKADLFINKGVVHDDKGELDLALEHFKKGLEISEELGNKRLIGKSLNNMGITYRRKGEFDHALDRFKKCLVISEELGNKRLLAATLNNMGLIYRRKGELDQALEYWKKSLAILEELGNKQGIAQLLNNIGLILLNKGDLDRAQEYYEKSLAIREEVGNKQGIAQSLNNIGLIYEHKGDLDRALEYHEKSLVIREEMGNKQGIAQSLNNIGKNFKQKGELDQALEYYKKGLVIREEVGNKQEIAISLNYIGTLYQELGGLEVALDLLKQSLVIYQEVGTKLNIADSLFCLIGVTIDLDEIEQARSYLSDLQQINEPEANKIIDLCSRLAEALILKTSKRMRNLSKAEEILEQIVEEVDEEIVYHDLNVQALVNLSELLLDELKSTGEEEVLVEVEEKVDKLFEIAKEQQSHTLLVESYWLKAQLALVRLDLIEARNLLTQAQAIAEEKGIGRLARKISNEHDQLLQQLDQWEKLIAEDVSIAERVKVANLEELVGWMARKREIKIDEQEDEPVMLLLVAESGLPVYSKRFDETKDLQDILISGFLTSINSFVQEAFEVKGQIRRIMHDEYTLSFNLIDTILFCYVYEGQSYTAMKKLEALITEVHESDIWSSLEEVGNRGYRLKTEELAQMNETVGEIFVTS